MESNTPKVRRAACEPCRKSKLSCDHTHPVCERCARQGISNLCSYRQRPFARSRRIRPADTDAGPRIRLGAQAVRETPTAEEEGYVTTPVTRSASRPDSPAIRRVGKGHPEYPNPGFLGTTSYLPIYNHLATQTDAVSSSLQQQSTADQARQDDSSALTAMVFDEALILRGQDLLRRIREAGDSKSLTRLVECWLMLGNSFPLADPFIEYARSALRDLNELIKLSVSETETVSMLLRNTKVDFYCPPTSSLAKFCEQMSGRALGLGSLGLFFCAACQATFDMPEFTSIYRDEDERWRLMMVLMRLSDDCLELALALDCLNDLHVVFQYENWILHSCMGGDQSYRAWRKLGDVISSLLALGYHEDSGSPDTTPAFLIELRQSLFAQTYSSDKNVAIFVGRAPRLSKRFCNFQLPSAVSTPPTTPAQVEHWSSWARVTEPNYNVEARWCALSTMLKEEILELLRLPDGAPIRDQIKSIEDCATAQWQAMPSQFRLEGSLQDFSGTSFHRGLLLSLRLHHLHVYFMLWSMDLRGRRRHLDDKLISVSQDIVAVITSAIMMRDRVANTGSRLIWKAVFYGLPAAGVVALATLRPSTHSTTSSTSLLKHLSTFVSVIEQSNLVSRQDPNFALVSRAISALKKVVQQAESSTSSPSATAAQQQQPSLPPQQQESWSMSVETTFPNYTDNFIDPIAMWDFDTSWDLNFATGSVEHLHRVAGPGG